MVTDISKYSHSLASKPHVTGEVGWRVVSQSCQSDDDIVLEGTTVFPDNKMRVGTLDYNL